MDLDLVALNVLVKLLDRYPDLFQVVLLAAPELAGMLDRLFQPRDLRAQPVEAPLYLVQGLSVIRVCLAGPFDLGLHLALPRDGFLEPGLPFGHGRALLGLLRFQFA